MFHSHRPGSGGVTRAQQVHIVDRHNQLRAWVAGGYQAGLPAAADMRALVSSSKYTDSFLARFVFQKGTTKESYLAEQV